MELSERRLEGGREARLLAGLELAPNGSSSKKLELEVLGRRAGAGDRCDSVSMVLSAREGRGLLSPPAAGSSTGLVWDCASPATSSLAVFVMLGVRFRVNCAVEIHCDEGLFLKPGSFDEVEEEEGWRLRRGSCSGRLPS